MALWIMFFDDERNSMDWEQRIWGYTGAAGLVQAFAAGYFVWDLIVTACYLDVFGLGLLAHATSALLVYSFGFVSWKYPSGRCLELMILAFRDPSLTTTAVPSSYTNCRPLS